ncbi:MAG: DNA replication/repair protein RecF [Crocinitomicaceae bacterium]|jgi:DNA replication and repair protein RecF|nr:DNA replication/repair protein RecF [Crocinitomicaceae bacterium]
MYLSTLQLINFKNYEEAEISLSSQINCFSGRNGSGKTNVLDAVHYLSMCKSYLNPVDKQNIRFDQPFFILQGNFQLASKEVQIHCSVKQGAKKLVKRNRKEYEKLADHIGQFPCVMISPYDRNLITEGSELRRKWMDGIISQFNKGYLDDLQKYAKVLEQRNALLKNMYEHGLFDRESIEVWDHQLKEYGSRIYKQRKDFLQEFIPVFQRLYSFIGEESEEIGLTYKSQLNDLSFDEILEQNRKRDAYAQYTNGGTHRDDLVFVIKGHPVKKFGSQGQQKSYLIALRLAQFEWLKGHLEVKPILLLDDIFDKLDERRVEKLMQLVSDSNFGQVLVTDTNQERLADIFKTLDSEIKYFRVENGTVEEEIPTVA